LVANALECTRALSCSLRSLANAHGTLRRYEILDDALVRPGRFDRVVRVELPSASGREAILDVKLRKLPVAPGVDRKVLAALTTGLSGAEIEGIVNEAAIRAVQRARVQSGGVRDVNMEDFEESVKAFLQSRMKGGLGEGGKKLLRGLGLS
jgi:cell division protease FtsH